MKQLTAILIGAGNRGILAYGHYALKNPNELRFVGVAEPNPLRRENFAKTHKIPKENKFKDRKDILNRPKFADIAIIATPDKLHVDPSMKAMKQGYHVLLEKPMAQTEKDCRLLVKTSERTGVLLYISHVLRYTQFFSKIKEIIDSGKLGKLITINHSENVSYWHYAHSFVRGNLSNQKLSSPMILTKCCHDLDLLYWFAGGLPEKISSFARTTYLSNKNKPEDTPERCTDDCPHAENCQYYSINMYVNALQPLYDLMQSENKLIKIMAWLSIKNTRLLKKLVYSSRKSIRLKNWVINQLTDDLTEEGIIKALKEGPYGRCVYSCNNDQVSAQVTNIKFSNGVVANLTMHGHSHREGRWIRIDGTKGTLIGSFTFTGTPLTFYDHLTGKSIKYKFRLSLGGHGGGDYRLIKGFLAAVRGEIEPLTTARQSLESHLMAFAADQSLKEGKIIHLNG